MQHLPERHLLFQEQLPCYNADNIADSRLVVLVFGIDSSQRTVDQLEHWRQEQQQQQQRREGIAAIAAVVEVVAVAVEEQQQEQQQ